MTEFSSVIVPLSVVLMLSLAVERFLEISRHLVELFLGIQGTRKLPPPNEVEHAIDSLSEKLQIHQERDEAEQEAEQNHKRRKELLVVLRSEEPTPATITEELKKSESETEWGEEVSNTTVLFVPATDPDSRSTIKEFVILLLAFALGILLARLFEVQLFHALLVNSAQSMSLSTDYLLTGLLVGGGSKPIHLLIRFVTYRRITTKKVHDIAEEAQAETMRQKEVASPAPAIVTSTDSSHEWVDIDYHGGVDRGVLETVHLRLENPSMIIYHHTAMHSNSRFEDVVNVIKNRDWVTGYNCVIMADGAIKPFCRWDRYGNHAVGYNRKSLGLSFNGNFETNPNTPYSNPDGRAGIQRPTEVQLKSGARIVALWALIYGIEENFDNKIIPHNKISSKGCPGDNFPYKEFRRWVKFYKRTWESSDYAMGKVAEFKLKPYLYV